MSGNYDVQQVCENGYQITAMYKQNSEQSQNCYNKYGFISQHALGALDLLHPGRKEG